MVSVQGISQCVYHRPQIAIVFIEEGLIISRIAEKRFAIDALVINMIIGPAG